ncbi:MAG: low molecular weight protein-tyrosine-phosphatase [Planctomycetota bacterium]
MSDPIRVCFVCLGNICRSPLAEGIFIHLAKERGLTDRFEVDSSGTGGWHAGNPADPRSIEVAKRHGVLLPSRARQFESSDTDRFDLFLAMDRDNRDTLIERGVPESKVRLMRSYDPEYGKDESILDVPDPYYDGLEGFDHVYDMLVTACNGLLDELAE